MSPPRLSPQQQQLVVAHLGDASHLAKAWARRRPFLWHHLEDVLAEARVGLVLAAASYQPTRGAWRAWASVCIHNHLLRTWANRWHVVPTPLKAVRKGYRPGTLLHLDECREGARPLYQRLAASAPTPEEEAERLQAPSAIARVRARLLHHLLAGAVSRDAARSKAVRGAISERRRARVRRDVAWWWEVQAQGRTLQEVGEEWGCTRQAVSLVVRRLDALTREWATREAA